MLCLCTRRPLIVVLFCVQRRELLQANTTIGEATLSTQPSSNKITSPKTSAFSTIFKTTSMSHLSTTAMQTQPPSSTSNYPSSSSSMETSVSTSYSTQLLSTSTAYPSSSLKTATTFRRATTSIRMDTTSALDSSMEDPNPLNLTLSELGLDPGGYWRCYGGSNDISLNTACYRSNGQAMYNTYSNQPAYGFQGPVYAGIDVDLMSAGMELRMSVTGTPASCKGSNRIPAGVRVTPLNSQLRILLFSSRVKVFSAWICSSNMPNVAPLNESILNISGELDLLNLAPLEPGPYLSLDLTFSRILSSAHQTLLQESICKVIWDSVDDNCIWRIWTSTSVISQSLWKISVKIILKSNSNAARANYLVTKLVNSNAFRDQYPLKDSAYYSYVTSPSVKLGRDSVYGCATHYDCQVGMFCSLNALQVWGSEYKGGGAGCDLCRYCLSDNIDAIDKWCPRDKCGAKAGGYPSCINAAKLFRDYACDSSYRINMSNIPNYESRLSSLKNSTQTTVDTSKIKARFLTPFNQLVGALTITQRRLNGTCLYKDDNVGRYSRMKDPAQGKICRGSFVDSRPYGYDPAFLSSSMLYDGTLDGALYYSQSERDPLSLQSVPFGFFPHKYDGQNHTLKHLKNMVLGEAANFKLYFEERLTGTQARKLIKYMEDGGFLDSQTDTVSVEAITLNSQLDIFAIISFTFTWQVRDSESMMMLKILKHILNL
jgi:hypothetical protein